MLISKTLCKSGSLVYIVPTGLQITLMYDAHGMLATTYEGFYRVQEFSPEFTKAIVNLQLVPNAIKLHGGTTYIYGVLYSDRFNSVDGVLPECEYASIVDDILSGNPKYRFYVGKVESGAASLVNPTAMNNWASLAGFDVLPTWLVPVDANDRTFSQYVHSNVSFPFKYPLIAGFVVYEGTETPFYHPLNLHTFKVLDAVKYTNHSGYIKYKVSYGDTGERCLYMNYPDAANFNVQVDSQVIVDGETVIWCDTKSSKFSNRLQKRIVCTSCGKILDVPDTGIMSCSDECCVSLLYPKIVKFCTILDLPLITKEQFDKYTDKKELTTLSDLLLLSPYSACKISAPIWQLLYAVIPYDVGLNKDWFIKFCNKCNNSYKTIQYYFNGPLRVATELDMNIPRRFQEWLSYPKNLLEMETILNSAQVELANAGKIMKFDGPPIFRNKTIFITGTFLHGLTEDIIAIFSSYGATVVTSFDPHIQCIVVGDVKDGISGEAIRAGRDLGIPIFDESEFFNKYDIDADLEKYLN